MTTSVTIGDAELILKYLTNVNPTTFWAAFSGSNTQSKIEDGAVLLIDFLQILGLFIPLAAIIANDAQAVLTIEKILVPGIQLLRKLHVFGAAPGTFAAFGQTFTSTILQG